MNGKEVEKNRVKELQREAQYFKETLLYNQLMKDMKYMANYQMYNNSKQYDDIVFGKATLWTIDVMEKKIDQLLQLK